jgi:hemolysin activation/secretion protein
VGSIYKSLDLPGFAHHVLALRAAGGITDDGSPNLFSVGGISGTSLEVFPGVDVGQQRRTFGVRGYGVGSEGGIRAYSAAVEYRAPLGAPSRGFRYIPVFIDKTSLTLFGETGRAYCPPSADTVNGFCSTAMVGNPVMASAGAELNIDMGLQLDVLARLRLGLAFPLINREQLGADAAQFYATFGASF